MISIEMFDRLVELGRQRGGLKTDDIRQVLRVESMTGEELVDVLMRLEVAGVSIEIDPALLIPRHRQMPPQPMKTAARTSPESVPPVTSDPRLSELGSPIKSVRGSAHRPPELAGIFVKMRGSIFLLVAALMLIVLALAFWRFA